MTTFADIQNSLHGLLGSQFEVHQRRETLQLVVPFYFDDGDGFVVHLRPADGERVEITDLAHTLQHFDYHSDVSKLEGGPRATQLDRIKLRHELELRDGEFLRSSSVATLIDDVLDYVQGLIEVTDLRNLDREIVSSTFRADLHALLTERVPGIIPSYVDRLHDPSGRYVIPYVLNGTSRPIAVFDIATDQHAAEALVVAAKHREWSPGLHLVAVERSQEDLNRRQVAWLSDGLDKQFSKLEGNEDAIVDYLEAAHEISIRLDVAHEPRDND